MKELVYVIKDPDGIHARPAGLLVKVAQGFKSSIILRKDAIEADAKKIFSVMKLAAKQSENITITCSGEDETEAARVVGAFFEENL